MYVSIGALVLLILILISIGVSLTKLQSADLFPPTQSACPDHWDISSNPLYCGVPVNASMKNIGAIALDGHSVDQSKPQNIGMCKNINKGSFGCGKGESTLFKLDKPPTNTHYQYVQLNNNPDGWKALYPGISERCAKKNWAQTMDIYWDGVSNFNGC